MTKTLQSLALSFALLLVLGSLAEARSAKAPDTPAAPAEDFVMLRAGTVVEDDIVRLGDLFDGITDPGLSATPVARAPEPGVAVEVGARWLYAVAKAHGVAWQPRSRYERISLKRASLDVPAEEIELALRAALADQGLDGNVQLVLDNPDLRLRLPSNSGGGLRITRLTLDPGNGRFLAQVVAPAAGEPKARLAVTGRAVELTEVPVLRRGVKPGEIIRERDIEWMSVQANRLNRTAVVDPASLVGMSPRRPIRAQDIVRSTDLQTPVLVTKNSMVTVRLETDRMQLSVQGRALEEGAEGDVIRVMNTGSNTVVSAVVVDTGAVVVVPSRVTAER